jgi:hypothetical protein
MDKHLDALGYLLAAVVFSVGFLSGRIHSNLDSTIRAVSEQSWRVRQAISNGSRLGPADLADLLGIVHSSTDYLAVASRVLNWTIFATTGAILIDAIGLRASGAKAPDHEMLVLGLLFAASLAVVTFSEFDVRRVSVEQKREIRASTLGRLQNLAHLVERSDTSGVTQELARLRETFPTWGLLIELEAYVELLDGKPRRGLDQIESLLNKRGDLYVSGVVGVACCLALDDLDSALALLARIELQGGNINHLDRLHQALAVSAGHLPALLSSHESPISATSSRRLPQPRSVGQGLLGQEIERRREPIHDLALDLDPAEITQTAPLMVTLELWEHDTQPSDCGSSGDLPDVVRLVLDPESRGSTQPALKSYTVGCHDPITLESFGLVAFACGEPRTALGFFESSIRLSPAAALSHWGRAIACHKVGWYDASAASLNRVATLSEDLPLLAVTRQLFRDGPARVGPAAIPNFYSAELNVMDCFQLALLGIDMGAPQTDLLRDRFAFALITLALEHNAVESQT